MFLIYSGATAALPSSAHIPAETVFHAAFVTDSVSCLFSKICIVKITSTNWKLFAVDDCFRQEKKTTTQSEIIKAEKLMDNYEMSCFYISGHNLKRKFCLSLIHSDLIWTENLIILIYER